MTHADYDKDEMGKWPEVLHGKRRLTYDYVARLAEVFHVSPAVFYPATPRE